MFAALGGFGEIGTLSHRNVRRRRLAGNVPRNRGKCCQVTNPPLRYR